jgi:nicotinate-nucleotide adenylyltransferase
MRGGIGIVGGTFDPIHIAHLRVAEEVREACGLDEVRLVPAAAPPHKRAGAVASAADRLRMVELATAGVPGLVPWDVELRRAGPSYTVDTLRTLREEVGPDARVVLVLGRDAFAELDTWREPGTILGLADLVVVTRPPWPAGLSIQDFPVALRHTLGYDRDSEAIRHESGRRVTLLRISALDVSATDLRARVAAGRSIRFLVPDAVATYVAEHGLYLRREDPGSS